MGNVGSFKPLNISIHALLAESDPDTIHPHSDKSGISIHALLAESDVCQFHAQTLKQISIHALLAESDTTIWTGSCRGTYFYPRSPCGERRWFILSLCMTIIYFYPRSPCGERR